MVYTIRVQIANPGRDNVRLEEALAIVNAKRLPGLKSGEQFIAQTNYQKDQVQSLLLTNAFDDDEIDVGELSRTEAHTVMRLVERDRAG